jgi:signal transduction histidine kinase
MKQRDARATSWKAAGLFVLAGSAWVLTTDLLLYHFVHDHVRIARFETAKGWAFIGLGALLIYLVILRTTTGLVRAQALNAAVVESIGDGILLLGQERNILYANAAATGMLRCESPDGLVGMDAQEFSRRFRVSYPSGALVPPDEYASQRAFDTGGTLQYEAVLHPPGSSELVLSVIAAPVRVEADDPPGMVVSVMHDITVPVQLDRLRDQFFAAAAHTLKTPIAVIKSNTQLLARKADAPLGRALAGIERQCDRIDRLVQNLLVLSRARSRTLQLHQHDIELRPLVEELARDIGTPWHRHQVAVELEGAPRVFADEERLTMAILNLAEEAARTSVAGSLLTLVLRQPKDAAEVGVRYQPLPPEEREQRRTWEDEFGDYDEIGITRFATTLVAEAHGGSIQETNGDDDATVVIRLPLGVAA